MLKLTDIDLEASTALCEEIVEQICSNNLSIGLTIPGVAMALGTLISLASDPEDAPRRSKSIDRAIEALMSAIRETDATVAEGASCGRRLS